MANEIRVNKHKFTNQEGKLSVKKIGNGFKNAVKAFLTFDLSYIASKTVGQSVLLYQGRSPGMASAIFDSIVIPAWYTVAIPLGLKNNVIETKETRKWIPSEVLTSTPIDS